MQLVATIALWLSAYTTETASDKEPIRGVIYEQQLLHPHAYGNFMFNGNLTVNTDEDDLTLVENVTSSQFLLLTCSGSFPVHNNVKNLTDLLTCSHGRRGNLFLSFDNATESSGKGTFSLSDGSTGLIVFGDDVYRGFPE